MHPDVRALVYAHDEIADLDPAARRLALRDILMTAGIADVAGSVARMADEIDGYGPITPLMEDPSVTDILINGPAEIWVERRGELEHTSCSFESPEHLTAWCERLITNAGGRVDSASPIADARLVDGARMHVVLPPIAPGGPIVSIRRFPEQPRSLDDLVAAGTMTDAQADGLRTAVRTGCSVVISGATGVGKTTLLNALVDLVDPSERIVVIEELPELHVSRGFVSLVARTASAEGRGAVGLHDLVRASLRMRPDRIVVGEVRGPEALGALWAMRTGHRGTMLSIHAASAADAARRLAALALMAAHAPSEATLARETEAAVDVYVHLRRAGDRRVVDELSIRP